MSDQLHHYGATQAEWEHFLWVLGLTDDLLPVVSNPHAKISPQSKIKSIGKIPSVYNRDGKVAGFKDWPQHVATEEEIKRWMQQPHYGICLQTRFAHAFDNDVPDPELAGKINEVIQKHILLPVRWRPKTGKCLHAFILKGIHSHREIKVKGGVVEFLGNGQHFVAAGTHTSGDRYEWRSYKPDGTGYDGLPEEIPEITEEQFETIWAELVEKFATGEATTRSSGTRKPKADTDTAKMLADPVTHFLADEGLVLSWNADGSANFTCPWKADHTTNNGDTETTYFPAGTRGYAAGHFKCMHAHCADRTDQDFLTNLGYYLDQFEDVSTTEDVQKEKIKRERFTPYKPSEFAKRPATRWLIKGILPWGETMSFGPSGGGKTFAELDQACCLALGIDWNGHKTIRSRVTYICAEGAGGFVSRLKAWAQHRSITLEDLDGWLCIIPDTPNFLDPKEIKHLGEQINAHFDGKCDVIFIDTLAQVTAGADENSAKEMGLAFRHARFLGAACHAGYKVVHHTGKDEEKGPRGTSLMKGLLDAMYSVFRKDDKHTYWIEKMKDDRDGFGFDFTLDTESVGFDADGDTISSCAVTYVGAAQGKKAKKQPKRGRWQLAVLTAWEAVGGGNVTQKEVIEEVLRSTVAEEGKKDRRREQAERAMEVLAQEGMFTLRDGAILIEEIGVSE